MRCSHGKWLLWEAALVCFLFRTQIHHNLISDVWGCDMNALVYPDNATFKLDIHHNLLWQSSQATRGQASKKSGYFFKRNPPGDPKYFDNTEKSKYDGGAKGLEDADYPGGYLFDVMPTLGALCGVSAPKPAEWIPPPQASKGAKNNKNKKAGASPE